MTEPYDFLIIGGGQAGVPLAFALAENGNRVALAERKKLGGSCVNFGCTPTKAVIASAQAAHDARQAWELGVNVEAVVPDFKAVIKRARSISRQSRSGIEERFANAGNPTLLRGHARFAGKSGDGFHLTVADDELAARQVIINTGTRSRIPSMDGLDEVKYLHAGNWLKKKKLPGHLVIIGAGYIGVEMAQFYHRMGSRVTVVDSAERILGHEDEDVSTALRGYLENQEIEFRLGEDVKRVSNSGSIITVTLGDQLLSASHLFVATGRRPNTDDLGLDSIGVETTERGFIKVDERLATSVDGVWAVGDVRGGAMFTHTSWDDHRIVLSQLAGDRSRTTDRTIPYGVFTDPQLGRVGATEKAAREEHGDDVICASYPMKNTGMGRESNRDEGFIKVVASKSSGRILGASVLASQGAELVHGFIDAMAAGATVSDIYNSVHIHPTLAEGMHSALKELVT